MQKNNYKKGIAALLVAFPDKKIDLELYWLFLKDLTDGDFLRAIAEIIATHKELYPGTNIIALIREKAKIDRRQTLLPGEAWAIVRREILRVGHYFTPKFYNDLIVQAVNIMGWEELCVSENAIADRAHFIKIYETLLNRHQIEQLLLSEKDIKKLEFKE